MTATGVVYVNASGGVLLGSTEDIKVDQVVAGNDMHIKGKKSIIAARAAWQILAGDTILEGGRRLRRQPGRCPFYTDLHPTNTITARAGGDVCVLERATPAAPPAT